MDTYAILAHGVSSAFVRTAGAVVQLVLRASLLRLRDEWVRVLVDLSDDRQRLEAVGYRIIRFLIRQVNGSKGVIRLRDELKVD